MRIHCTRFLACSGIAFEAGFRPLGGKDCKVGYTAKLYRGPAMRSRITSRLPPISSCTALWLTVLCSVPGYAQILAAAPSNQTASPGQTLTVSLSLILKARGSPACNSIWSGMRPSPCKRSPAIRFEQPPKASKSLQKPPKASKSLFVGSLLAVRFCDSGPTPAVPAVEGHRLVFTMHASHNPAFPHLPPQK